MPSSPAADNPAQAFGPEGLAALLARFGLVFGRLAPEHPLPGSPERCLARFALADAQGRLWMLERLHPSQAARRQDLGLLLAALGRDPGLGPLLPAPLPVAGPDAGLYVLALPAGPQAGCWQLSPFVLSKPLPRPGYLDQPWRGAAVARLILAVQRAGATLPQLPQAPQPDLPAYCQGLWAAMARHRPGLLPRLAPVRKSLTDLPDLLAAQPLALAHGDLHPLNILWGADADEPLRALMDWEFAGARPRLFDAANCLGCAGFEHPSGLGRGFALGLVRGLFGPQGLPGAEAALLPSMLLLTRLAWLSEWLRKADAELLAMELDYLDILLAQGPALARLWREG